MATVTKRCECGTPVEVEIPDGVKGAFREMVLRWQVVCDRCEKRNAAEQEARERESAETVRLSAYRTRVRKCGIPMLFREKDWVSLDTDGRRDVIDAARRWAAGDLRGLLLTGEVGVGKTYLAAVAAWAYLHRGPLRWTSVPGLMASLAADWNSPRRQAALNLIDGTDALALDDLDKSRPSAYAAEQLFGAIDARVAAGAPLLVTTNLSLGELVEKYPDPFGESIGSRLAGYCEAYGLLGSDRRLGRVAA